MCLQASARLKWASDLVGAAIEDVAVDHRGADTPMAEEFLDCSDVVSALERAGGEVVAKTTATVKVAEGEQPWYVVRLRQ